MIILYIVFLAIGIMSFFLTKKLSLFMRIVIALLIFLVLSLATTLLFVKIGDKPASDAVTVFPEKNR